jgi:hypothetical protein
MPASSPARDPPVDRGRLDRIGTVQIERVRRELGDGAPVAGRFVEYLSRFVD